MKGTLIKNDDTNQCILAFPYHGVMIKISGDINEREIIKIAQSFTD